MQQSCDALNVINTSQNPLFLNTWNLPNPLNLSVEVMYSAQT